MKKIKVSVSFGCNLEGADKQDEIEIEVEDNATNEEIEKEAEEAAQEWMWGFVDLGFSWEPAQEGQSNE